VTTAPPHPALLAAQTWHLAGSLVSLKRAVDSHWPKRDKRSDGGIGDEAHQKRGSASDHNPWLNNTVRAYDYDADGIDAKWLAESLRLAGLRGDRRLAGASGDVSDNGYVIHAGLITSPDFSRWVAYSGPNPHTTIVHVSVTRLAAGYEDGSPWPFIEGVAPIPPGTAAAVPVPVPAAPAGYGPTPGNSAKHAPHPDGDPVIVEANYPPPGADAVGAGEDYRAQFGNRGPKIRALQAGLNDVFPAYSALIEDGDYGPNTAAVIEEFAKRAAEDAGTPQGDRDGLAAADGNNVGPRLARALLRYGIRL
jgi:hypothetical protein